MSFVPLFHVAASLSSQNICHSPWAEKETSEKESREELGNSYSKWYIPSPVWITMDREKRLANTAQSSIN